MLFFNLLIDLEVIQGGTYIWMILNNVFMMSSLFGFLTKDWDILGIMVNRETVLYLESLIGFFYNSSWFMT